MNDLISRQAAIDAIDRLDIPEDMCVFEILSHIELEIGNLPSAQPEPQWIPCSERVPEKSGVYIVTEKEYFVDDREHTGRFNLTTEQVEFEDGKWRRASFYEVIAWMPLPEPYKYER